MLYTTSKLVNILIVILTVVDAHSKQPSDLEMIKFAFFILFCVFVNTSKGKPKPPAPGECKDDPDYANKCHVKAAMSGYCVAHYKFMQRHCRKSCGFCSGGKPKPPAPSECKDDPDYADKCHVKAAMSGYCGTHYKFMQRHCRKSCGFCSGGTPKPPAPAECHDDLHCADKCPTKAAMPGYCKAHKLFMQLHCRKSCGCQW